MNPIINFLRDNIEPLEDGIYGTGYMASAYLKDGTFLPCVLFRNPKRMVALAIERFTQTRSQENQSSTTEYVSVVKSFVVGGNRVNDHDIRRVEKSDFAFPPRILGSIKSETSMDWTGFVAKMKRRQMFFIWKRFSSEFFSHARRVCCRRH